MNLFDAVDLPPVFERVLVLCQELVIPSIVVAWVTPMTLRCFVLLHALSSVLVLIVFGFLSPHTL